MARGRQHDLELIDRIGGGSHGEVWRARQRVDGAGDLVAVKLLGGISTPKEAQLRFFREQAFRLEHPNLVSPRGVVQIDGELGLVMDLVDGRDLQELAAANGGGLPDDVLTTLAAQLLDALGWLHERHVIHRDVTPTNVLVTCDGGSLVARLGDLGSALDLDGPRLTSVPGVVGTVGFAAPELLAGTDAEPSSDLWSLGATLRAVRSGPQTDGATGGEGATGSLDRFLDAIGEPDPAARPQSAAEAAALLGDPAPVGCADMTVPRLPPLPARRRSGRVVASVAAAVTVVAILAVGIVTATQGTGVELVGDAAPASAPEPEPVASQRLVPGTERAGFDSSVGIAPDGLPVVAHVDLRDGTLVVSACEDAVCSRATSSVVDPRPRSGYYPSLALTRDGLPVVAVQDSSTGQLVLHRCGDRTCATSERSTVPLPGTLGAAIAAKFTGVAPEPLDRNASLLPRLRLVDDVPVLTFDDVTTDQVWLARCSDPDCSDAWSVTVVGPGAGGSLAIGPSGLPVVAGTGRIGPLSFGALWVVECQDPACSTSRRVPTTSNASTASIAAGPSGYTVVAVSYRSPAESDGLVVLGCSFDCATPAITRIAERSDPDGNPSVAVRNGLPVVAFRAKNAPAPGLQFLDCADLACAALTRSIGINEEVPVDDRAPEAGHDVSLAVAPDGRAVASNTLLPADRTVQPAQLVVSADV
ncbi:MAG: serine/threonine-protein kinase [Microthrixaceae bacterium]